MGNLSTEKYHEKLSLPRVTLPIRAADSANVRQRRPRHETPALDHGRVAARTLGSFHPFWSTKIVRPVSRRPVDSRGVQKENSISVSKRRGDREESSNIRSHSHRRRSQSYERHRCDSCRPQRGDSRSPDDPGDAVLGVVVDVVMVATLPR